MQRRLTGRVPDGINSAGPAERDRSSRNRTKSFLILILLALERDPFRRLLLDVRREVIILLPCEQTVSFGLCVLFLGKPFFDKDLDSVEVVSVFRVGGHVVFFPAFLDIDEAQPITIGANHVFLSVRCPLLADATSTTKRVAGYGRIVLIVDLFLLDHRQIVIDIASSATFMHRHDVIENRRRINLLALALNATFFLNGGRLRALLGVSALAIGAEIALAIIGRALAFALCDLWHTRFGHDMRFNFMRLGPRRLIIAVNHSL